MINKVASFLLKGPNPILKFFNSFEICSPKVVVLVAINPYEGVVHSTSIREVLVRSSKRLSEPGTLIKENLMAILCYDVFLGLRFHAWRLSQRKCFRPSMNKRIILEIFFFASNLSRITHPTHFIPRRKLAFTSISKLLCDMDLPCISEVAYIEDGLVPVASYLPPNLKVGQWTLDT